MRGKEVEQEAGTLAARWNSKWSCVLEIRPTLGPPPFFFSQIRRRHRCGWLTTVVGNFPFSLGVKGVRYQREQCTRSQHRPAV